MKEKAIYRLWSKLLSCSFPYQRISLRFLFLSPTLLMKSSFFNACLCFAFYEEKLQFLLLVYPFLSCFLMDRWSVALYFTAKLGNFPPHLFNELITILPTLIWSTTIYVWLPQVPRLTEIVSLPAATNAIENKNLVSLQSVSSPFSFLIIYFIF